MKLNGLVIRLIEGPGHRMLPGGLTGISYTGPISGNAISLPAQSVADGSRFLVVAAHPEGKRWWRAFRHPQPARLVRGGCRFDATGHVLEGPERGAAVRTYLAAHPRSRRAIGPETPVLSFEMRAP